MYTPNEIKRRNAALIVGLALLLILSFILSGPFAAKAAGPTVTNTNDSGPGSLRQALIDAAAGETITFSLASGSTITITSDQLLIDKSVTISGPGASALSLARSSAAGTPDFSIFRIATGSLNVTISGMTITNGKAPSSGDGGGISSATTGTLNVTGCVINANSAAATGKSGGGIHVDAGVLNVTGSTISGNTADSEGGGIRSLSTDTLTITDSTIAGNTSGGSGGGIAASGPLSLTGTTIINNVTAGNGGGIYNSNGTFTVTGSTININTAGTGFGGGIYHQTGTLNVTNSMVSSNTANGASGGGGGISNGDSLNLTNSTVSNNVAGGAGGGGIFNSDQLSLTAATITGNTATGDGGGIFNSFGDAVVIRNTILAHNTAASGPDAIGALNSQGYNLIGIDSGAIVTPTTADQLGTSGAPIDAKLGPLADNGGPTRTHALLSGSPAIDRGHSTALTTDQRGLPRYDSPSIVNDGDGADIGAFEVQGAATPTPTPTPSASPAATIIVNSTGEADNIGPAPLCDTNPGPAQTCTLRAAIQAANTHPGDDIIRFEIPLTQPNCDAGTGNCTINLEKALPELNTNMAIEGPGADKLTVRRDSAPEYRIFTITTAGAVTISGLKIRNGNAGVSNNGGGIANSAGTLNLINSTLESNTAGIGGGFSNAAGTVNITGSTFNSNHCSSRSGGAISNSGTVNLTDSTITENLCQGVDPSGDPRRGGGIANNMAGIVNVSNSRVVNNIGSTGAGISNTGKVMVTESVLAGNSASTDRGGGLLNSGNGAADIVNSTFLLNTATQGGGIFNTDTASVTVTNSLIDGVDSSLSGIANQSGNLKVSNSTITRNGTGVINGTSGTATVKSTIIAGNSASDVQGSFTSAGFNLIGESDGSLGF